MPEPKLAGGLTQDEILAVSLFKLGLCPTDTVLEIGCGTGKVTVALSKQVKKVCALDMRPEAISVATGNARQASAANIEFACVDAVSFLTKNQVFDCAFIGGTKNIEEILPLLSGKVRRNIVINAVMVRTLDRAVETLRDLGIFNEVVQVQVSRSHDIAGSIMFRPIDPVFIIVGRGTACS